MNAFVENEKYITFIHSYEAFIVGINKMVARNIGDKNIRSKRFPQSFKGKWRN